MEPIRFDRRTDDPQTLVGALLAHSLYPPGERRRPLLKKGHRLTAADLDRLGRAELDEIHLVRLDPGELTEDEASARIARAAAGPGVTLRSPVESQVRLAAAARGVLRVDAEALAALNLIEDVSVYTLYDSQVVDAGKVVGAAKVTPLAVPAERVAAVERLRVASGPAIDVWPLRPHRVAALVRERLDANGRVKFEAVLRHKLGWLGSELIGVRDATGDAPAVQAALSGVIGDGAEIVLVGGVTSLDPLDPVAEAVGALGGRYVRRGMPAHPGSTYWLADVGGVPVLGVASCGLFSEATLLDILLPRLLTGERPTAADLAQLGLGGLLGKDLAFRFPDYGER